MNIKRSGGGLSHRACAFRDSAHAQERMIRSFFVLKITTISKIQCNGTPEIILIHSKNHNIQK